MSGNARLLVQALKGSKSQILLAFLFARKALDVRELISWTGLKRQTLYEGLGALKSMGLLGNQSLTHGRDVWIPCGEMLPLFQMSEKRTPELPTTITTESLYLPDEQEDDSEKNNDVVVVEDQMSEKRTPADLRTVAQRIAAQTVACNLLGTPYESYDASFEENLAACKSVSIGEPKATKIACMTHVTPGFIRDHKDSLRKGETLGLAILRIENGETPRVWEKQIDELPPREEE